MNFFRQWGEFMTMGAKALAQWETDNANTILRDRRRLIIIGLLLIPVFLGGIAFAEQVAEHIGDTLPDVLGGHKAYSPAFYSVGIFVVSILIGLGAGLITGCIGAGGGFVIAPALMSAGVKGILAVGTDLFHIFAKAIMGSVIHRKLGNVSVPLAAVFLIGAILGATVGGIINRVLYEINPVLSDAFITSIYALMLGFLGIYAMTEALVTGTQEILGRFGLPYVPMIHCFLSYQDHCVDLSEGNDNGKNGPIDQFLFTAEVAATITAKDEYRLYRRALKDNVLCRPELEGTAMKTLLKAREEGLAVLRHNLSLERGPS